MTRNGHKNQIVRDIDSFEQVPAVFNRSNDFWFSDEIRKWRGTKVASRKNENAKYRKL